MVNMTTHFPGRTVFNACLNAAIRSALFFILALSTVPRAGAEEALSIRTLNEIQASSENGRLTVTLKFNRIQEPEVLAVENPPRLVLDFTDTINRVPFKKLPLNTGPVAAVRVSQYRGADPAIARVVFDLGKEYGSHRIDVKGSSVQVTFLQAGSAAGGPVSSSTVKPVSGGSKTMASPAEGGNARSVRTEARSAESEISNLILSEIEASHENGSLTVTLKMSRSLEPTVLMVENPPRLVLDFTGTINKVRFKKLPLNAGAVQGVRVSQYRSGDPAIARVVFDLGEKFSSHRISLDGSSVQVAFLPEKTAADIAVSLPKMADESIAKSPEIPVPGNEVGVRAAAGAQGSQGDSEQTDLTFPEKSEPAARLSMIGTQAPVPDEAEAHAEEVPIQKPPEPAPAAASAKTASESGQQDPVQSFSPPPAKSEASAAPRKPAEPRYASTANEPDTGIKTEEAAPVGPMQASSGKLKEGTGVDARRPAAPSQASKRPVRPSLGDTLDRVGNSVEQFRENFKSIACTEFVSQTKLGKKETVIYKKDQEYEYMIFMDVLNDGVSVEESRVEKKSKGRTKDLPLLITKGFPTLLLVFHPFYQGSFKYKFLGEETVEGRNLIRIDFKHIKGRRATSILNLKDKNYPLELEGTAWIDPESYNIHRITAGLIKPMEEVGLETFTSDVRYEPMSFTPNSSKYWMPRNATVEVMTKRQHWRNVHRFEDYRLFSISSESEISIP